MSSNINPNNINGNFPVAGQDNDSQGFRDNFTNILNNFSFASTEITALQSAVTNLQDTVATNGNVTANYANIAQGLQVGTTSSFGGDAAFAGNIVISGSNSAIKPAAADTNDIGTSGVAFRSIYSGNVVANTATAMATVSSYQLGTTNIVPSAPSATQNIDIQTGSNWYFTSNASANVTLNFRGSSSKTIANSMAIGQTLNVEVIVKVPSTPYYPSAYQIDGVSQTIKWKDDTTPTAGDANSTNQYVYSIIKTGTGAYDVYATKNKFSW